MSNTEKSLFTEQYGELLGGDDRGFDIQFWQSQGTTAIFNAAYDMIRDYLLLRDHYVDEPELQRTVESFQKAQV